MAMLSRERGLDAPSRELAARTQFRIWGSMPQIRKKIPGRGLDAPSREKKTVMKCIKPILVSGMVYGKFTRHYVPCGKCMACLQRKRQQWVFRCKQEMKVCDTCYFVTLTYDEEHVPRDDSGFWILDKRDVQLFFKRLRKKYPDNNIRYFLCGEYGPHTFRPHYHALIWNLPEDNSPLRIKTHKLLLSTWKQGNVYVGENVKGEAISYCAKYCLTPSYTPENLPKPFILTSRRPGIGSNYVNELTRKHHSNGASMVSCDGIRIPLPSYYKSKVEPYLISMLKYEQSEEEKLNAIASQRREMRINPEKVLLQMRNEKQAALAYESNTRRKLLKSTKI